MAEDLPTKMMKLVAVGDGSVGKTCLLISYSNNKFPEEYVPTVFDNYVVDITTPNSKIALTLWDTAGQEEYDNLRPLSYPQTHVYLLCFAINNSGSFENAEVKWSQEIRSHSPDAPIILVGTKSDIPNRTVTQQQGEDLADQIGATCYMECSAKTKENVKNLFDTAVKEVLLRERKTKKKKCSLL